MSIQLTINCSDGKGQNISLFHANDEASAKEARKAMAAFMATNTSVTVRGDNIKFSLFSYTSAKEPAQQQGALQQ